MSLPPLHFSAFSLFVILAKQLLSAFVRITRMHIISEQVRLPRRLPSMNSFNRVPDASDLFRMRVWGLLYLLNAIVYTEVNKLTAIFTRLRRLSRFWSLSTLLLSEVSSTDKSFFKSRLHHYYGRSRTPDALNHQSQFGGGYWNILWRT